MNRIAAASSFACVAAAALACNALVDGPNDYRLRDLDAGTARYGDAASVGPDPLAGWPMFGGNAGHTHHVTSLGSTFTRRRPRWKIDNISPGAAPAVDADGTAYFTTAEGRLYSVALDGLINWNIELGGPSRCTPALAANGAIFVTTASLGLSAWSRQGKRLWSFAAGSNSHPVIAGDGTIYVIDDRVSAISPAGALLWSYPLATASGLGGEAVALGEAGVIYAVRDGLHAINRDGTSLWRAPQGDSQSPPPVVTDGVVYAGFGTQIVALDGRTGAMRPNWPQELTKRLQAGPAVDGAGLLHFINGTSLAPNAPGGNVVYEERAPIGVTMPTPAIDGADVVYAARDVGLEGPVVVRDPYRTHGGMDDLDFYSGGRAVGVAIGKDGTVFVATAAGEDGDKGSVFAIAP